MSLIRTPHFKQYVERVTSECWQRIKGLSEAQAKEKFMNNFYEDYNMMSFVMDNTFPETYREDNDYVFVSSPMIHTFLPDRSQWNVGKCTVKIKEGIANVKFDAKGFVHGHTEANGRIHCYGDYRNFQSNTVTIGFASALLDTYAFASVSKDTLHWGKAIKI